MYHSAFGFVWRRRSEEDRRQVLIRLVRDGPYQHLQRTFQELAQAYGALIEDYTPEQREVLLDFARRANQIVVEQTRKLRELEGN